jgi:hypothetical protein
MHILTLVSEICDPQNDWAKCMPPYICVRWGGVVTENEMSASLSVLKSLRAEVTKGRFKNSDWGGASG